MCIRMGACISIYIKIIVAVYNAVYNVCIVKLYVAVILIIIIYIYFIQVKINPLPRVGPGLSNIFLSSLLRAAFSVLAIHTQLPWSFHITFSQVFFGLVYGPLSSLD